MEGESEVASVIVNSQSSSSTLAAENAPKHPPFFHKSILATDRFIVPRRKYNIEAANYVLTKKPAKKEINYKVDIVKEMDMLNVKWRKDLMHDAMVKENLIPGLGQKEVLRQSSLSTQPKEKWMEDYCQDGTWKSRPRKKPLISNVGLVLDMPHDNTYTRYIRNRIDWSSTNIIAGAYHEKLTLFEVSQPQMAKEIENRGTEKICALKWNNAGDLLIICTFFSIIKLYDMVFNKIIWTNASKMDNRLSSSNHARGLCWSPDDKLIAVGCTEITIYCAQTGRIINSVVAHSARLLSMAISPTSRYIASTSLDKEIRIFTWPELQPVFDIMYYYPANELAWHPFDGNKLCIGGGLSDGSLSLWDMAIQDVISYRVINFFGSINHLAWNKISGELVVHWTYIDEENEYPIMPVLASFDRVVDVIPVAKSWHVNAVLWKPDHSQLAIHNDECLSVWNFFGDEYQSRRISKKQRKVSKESKKNTGHKYFSNIHHNIR